MTKVKVSLYKDGVEVAWVIFDKQPGSNDNWFQPSLLIGSYPWDTKLLKSSSHMSLEPQQYNDNTRFYIVESNPDFYLRPSSPHKYWMKIISISNECEYGIVKTPYILYSKGPNPTLLSKSRVSLVVKWSVPSGRYYKFSWAEAQNLCETRLNVPIATFNDVNDARVNQPYQYCFLDGCLDH